jgi:hypothetical protein
MKVVFSKKLEEYKKGNKIVVESTINILLNLDKKLDERSKTGVLMVYVQYCTIFYLTFF